MDGVLIGDLFGAVVPPIIFATGACGLGAD